MRPFMLPKTIIAIIAFVTACEIIPSEETSTENLYHPIELTTKSAEFVEKGNTFAFKFLEKIDVATSCDYIVSPISMQFLLGMILNGTDGDTKEEIASVLGYGEEDVEAVNEYCLSMLQQLPELDNKIMLSLANALFVNQDYRLKDSYVGEMKHFYEAEVSHLDFGASNESAAKINQWASDHTQGMVDNVIEVTSDDMLVYLLNTLYFRGTWVTKFDASLTVRAGFTMEGGKSSEVMMMNQAGSFSYVEADEYQAVRLPYGNGAFSMTVLLPKSGYMVSDVAAALKKTSWKALVESMRISEVNLGLPKFETKYGIVLNDILCAMGMPFAFDDVRADFSKMSEYGLCLSYVRQDAAIKVNEDGTEVAAVSSAGVFTTDAGPSERVVVYADHPFLYVISEASTDAVLFAGRFGNENAE